MLREEKERENQRWSEEDMEMIDDSVEVDDPKILDWSVVLKPVKVEAMTETGIGLCSLLAMPPPLEQLRLSEKDCPMFSKVPETPMPRKQHQTYFSLFQIQKKVEGAMNMLVHCAESGDQRSLHVQAAMLRSAWEDLLQMRRSTLAGREFRKLDPRSDDTRPKLLTREEEGKLNKGFSSKVKGKEQNRKDQGPPHRFYRDNNWRGRSYSRPNWRSRSSSRTGKGKGKGKGDSQK